MCCKLKYISLNTVAFRCAIFIVAIFFVFVSPLTLYATEQAKKSQSKKIKNALYNGAVLENADWFLYSSGVRALWGGIHDTGWQVRVMAGKGHYRYGRINIYEGDKSVIEAMIGYQYVMKPFFLKLYVGPHFESHVTQPLDKNNSLIGQKLGGKVQFEGWMDWGTDRNFIALDASFSTLEKSYMLNSKVGIQPIMKTQIGLEAEASGNHFSDRLAGGVFMSYQWKKNTVLGLNLGAVQTSLDQKGFYGKLKYDVKF